MLVSYIASHVPDPAAEAEATGCEWGRHLTDDAAPFTTEPDARAALVDMFEGLGCAPRVGVDSL